MYYTCSHNYNNMTTNKSLTRFESVHHTWGSALRNYSLEQLLKKPSPTEWSLGQLYVHLIQSTLKFHLVHAGTCQASATNKGKRKNMKGIMTYHVLGSFPPIKITVPGSPEYTPLQPASKEQLVQDLARTLGAMKAFEGKVATGNAGGKVSHPAFAWLDAGEWYQMVEMHWRHHLRQKKGLDAYLRGDGQ